MTLTARKKQFGFTIVELLVVIVVIAILASLAIASYTGIQQRARDTERQADMRELATALELFRTDNGFYPKWSGFMNSRQWAVPGLAGYVNDPAIFVAPRANNDYSIVSSGSSAPTGNIAIDNLTPEQYYYFGVNDPRSPDLDPNNPRSYNICPWTADGGCKRFFLAWRSEATNELHIIQSLQK